MPEADSFSSSFMHSGFHFKTTSLENNLETKKLLSWFLWNMINLATQF